MSRVCYKCKGVGCPVGARTKDGLCEHCQPPPEKQECSCHEWTGREPRTYHCSHCSMRGMRINMPHQDEGMEWEERLRTVEFGFDLDAEKLIPFIKLLLTKDRQQLREKMEKKREKATRSNELYYKRYKTGNPFDIGRETAFTDILAILEGEERA